MTALIKFEDLDIPALTEIAQEAFEEVTWSLEKTLDRASNFGRILLIVRQKIPHGEWQSWIESTFGDTISLRKIQRYMQIANASDQTLLEGARTIDEALNRISVQKPSVEVIEPPPVIPIPEPVVAELLIPSDESAVEIDSVTRTSRPHVANNSGQNEWYTPQPFIDAAVVVMGAIDLDPASSKVANKTVKATKFYNASQDGLTKKWAGRVFMNPPYAQPLIAKFSNKLAESLRSGDVTNAIALVNNATDTAWWQELASVSTAICFPKTRVKFLDPDGNPGAPLQGQSVLYFGDQPEAFFEAFNVFGLCVESQHLVTASSNKKTDQ